MHTKYAYIFVKHKKQSFLYHVFCDIIYPNKIYFIKMDMYEYINKGYAGSYSPFWIFGGKQYKQNIDFIFSRKHTVEFDSAWIHYLSIKAIETEQERETDTAVKEQANRENIIEIQNWRSRFKIEEFATRT